jgi:eukaryotic-like serine/threonine-protein kinase
MPAPPDEVLVGSVLRETYEIVAPLGSGGMGVVYVARHLRLPGKQVAVKVLRTGGAVNPEIYARFRREAEIASRLGHPNIVEILDFDTLPGGRPFLVMELLRGESLAERLHRGPLSWAETQSIARQVGSALRAAHQAGVVHRDLKPENVFLVPSEAGGVVSRQVKLLDFGISKIISEPATLKTQDQVLMGTPLYMSPEQALGKNSQVDARTDIFALGSMLYEMLSGQPPFAGENIPQIVYRIAREPAPPLEPLCPQLPSRTVAAIERALAKKADERFPDVASFIAELTGDPLQALGGPVALPVPPPASGPTPPSSKVKATPPLTVLLDSQPGSPSSRSPGIDSGSRGGGPAPVRNRRGRLWIGGSVLALVLVLGGGGLVWRNGSKPERPTPVQPQGLGVSATVQPGSGPVKPTPATIGAGSGPGVEVAVPPPVTEPPTRAAPPTPPQNPSHPSQPGVSSSTVAPERAREARELLVGAEKALAAGDARAAIDLARRVERSDPGLSTHALLAKAYCALGDLGNARPEYDQLPRAQRRAVRGFCGKHGIDLIE